MEPRLLAALEETGFRCQRRDDAVVCDAHDPKRPTLVAVYLTSPPRVVLAVPLKLGYPCGEALASLNAYNRDYDFVTLSCKDRDLDATGVVVIPDDGITPAGFGRYASWWAEAVVTSLRDTGLGKLLQ